MVDMKITLRDALPGDTGQLTSLLLRSRTQAMPWLASPHDEPSTRWWMQHVLLAEHCVRVADDGSRVLGFAALTDTWIEQLFVDPEHQGQGGGADAPGRRQASAPSWSSATRLHPQRTCSTSL